MRESQPIIDLIGQTIVVDPNFQHHREPNQGRAYVVIGVRADEKVARVKFTDGDESLYLIANLLILKPPKIIVEQILERSALLIVGHGWLFNKG